MRLLELLCYRESKAKRETRLLNMLRFVHSTLWKYMFGRQARDLEQSNTVQPPPAPPTPNHRPPAPCFL